MDLFSIHWDFVLTPLAQLHSYLHSKKQGYSAFQENLREFKRYGAKILHGKKIFWAHGASIGEIKCLIPTIKVFLDSSFSDIVLLSYTSPDGLGEIKRSLDSHKEQIVTCPLMNVGTRFLRKAVFSSNLQLCMIAEKDIWPRILTTVKKKAAPLMNIDASFRASDNYLSKRLRHIRYSSISKHFDAVCVRTKKDYEKAKRYFPQERVFLTGPSKSIDSYQRSGQAGKLRSEYIELLQLIGKKPILVFGNFAENEAHLTADILRDLISIYPNLAAVVAPRYTRKPAVMKTFHKALLEAEIKYIPLSSLLEANKTETDISDFQVIVADKTGYLSKIYAAADLAVMGGAFLSSGGHNIFEPISMGIPTICGPNMTNWEGIVDTFVEADAIVQTNAEKLFDRIAELLANPDEAKKMAERAFGVLTDLSRAAEKNIKVAKNLVKQ